MLPNQNDVTAYPPVTSVTLVTFMLRQPGGMRSKSALEASSECGGYGNHQ